MKTLVGVLILTLGLCVPATRAAEQYARIILDLPANGTASGAKDINANGTVVGWCNLKDNSSRGFRWTPSTPNGGVGSIALLECLPGDVSCEAVRVNVHGHAVGFSRSSGGTQRAVLWTGTTAIDLGLSPGYNSARAQDINDAGEIVGVTDGGTDSKAAFRWTPIVPNGTSGTITLLPHLPDGIRSSAMAINNTGTVVGWSQLPGPMATYAVRWSSAGVDNLDFNDAWDFSMPRAINEIGSIFGNVTVAMLTQAWGFAGSPSGLSAVLGTLPGLTESEVHGLNGPGRVVGKAYDNNDDRAFIWGATTGMHDLNALISPSTFELRMATGINDLRRIVGEGYSTSLGTRAFLLIPGVFPKAITRAVAINKRPYFEICDPLHACQTINITNVSSRSLTGPFQVVLTRLTPGRHLANAAGTFEEAPFVSVPLDSLAPGASHEVQLLFNRTRSDAEPFYGVALYAGEF